MNVNQRETDMTQCEFKAEVYKSRVKWNRLQSIYLSFYQEHSVSCFF